MTVGRNEPCPCGSGRKYKKCCGLSPGAAPAAAASGAFRFEPGSYGGPCAGYMPSILCQRRVSESAWRDHFVLANPQSADDDEDAAVAVAESDLAEAFAAKRRDGTDAALAMSLKAKGYVNIDGFRRAKDPEPGNQPFDTHPR